jgi:hypothetical protein
MPEEMWDTLLRFHREVALPAIEERIVVPLRDEMAAFRRDTTAHFDTIHTRLDRLESESYAMNGTVTRTEERLGAVDQKLNGMALKSELLELKARVGRREE